MPEQEPTFEARPVKLVGPWYVLVTWPSGRTERVTGFGSGRRAIQWINGNEAKTWLAQKRMTNGEPPQAPARPEPTLTGS